MSIYVVAPKKAETAGPEEFRLVRAESKAQVRQHLIDENQIALASQDDLVKLIKAGIEIEEAASANPSN